MFSILDRRVLARGSFVSLADLEEKIYAYMHWHNETDRPFEWSYRPKSWSQKHVQTSGERSYAGGGSLPATRYHGSLLPFFCVAMAHGVRACAERAPRVRPFLARVVLWGSLGVCTVVTFALTRRDADAGRETLRSMERDLDAQAR